MDPSSLITDKIVDYCKNLQFIVIVGYTKSGKVTIAKKLAEKLNRTLLIADDYIDTYGHSEALNWFKRDTLDKYYSGEQFIVEGVLCFRLLRNIINSIGVIPDLIIKTECSEQTIRYFYNLENPEKNITQVMGFNLGLEKIYNEYLNLLKQSSKKVKLLQLNTSIF